MENEEDGVREKCEERNQNATLPSNDFCESEKKKKGFRGFKKDIGLEDSEDLEELGDLENLDALYILDDL